MGFFKRANKKFDYKPRYYEGEGNPFKIEHKLDQFRKTAGKNKGIKSKFNDAISDIKFRGLLGAGPRFKLSKSKDYRFYLGTLLMFEYEESSDNSIAVLRDFRGSTYLSCSIYPLENLSLVSTTYYQPLLKQFSDFRISNETSIGIKVLKNLLFKTTFTYNFSFP